MPTLETAYLKEGGTINIININKLQIFELLNYGRYIMECYGN